MVSVRFARLSFEAKLRDFTTSRDVQERRKETLLEVIDWDTDVNEMILRTDDPHHLRHDDWGFGGINSTNGLVHGRIAKEREQPGRIKDSAKRDYVAREREDADVAFFVIDLNSSIMAYEFRRNVGPKAPYWVVESAFNGYYQGEESLSAIPIIDREEISAEIDAFYRVSGLVFSNLHPTNPDSTDRSDPMDKFLQDSGINRLGLDADNEDAGSIDIRGTPLLDGGLSLAEEGYGKATVEGEDESGNEKRVSTEDNPIEIDIDVSESDERNRERFVEEIQLLLDRLES